MKSISARSITPAIFLIMVVLGCNSVRTSAANPFLEDILSASDDRGFNNALRIYGTLQPGDVDDVVKAVGSASERRRKYASWMLKLCREDSCHAPQIDTVRATKDVVVWTSLVETAARHEPAVLRERTDLLTKALESKESEILAPGLRVALAIGHPGINEMCRQLLDSKDEKVLEVVLTNLSPAVARQEGPRLSQMLADEKTYDGVSMEIAMALIRSEDKQYYPQIKAYVQRLKAESQDHSFFNETTFSEDKQTVDFLWQIARMKDGDIMGDLRDQAYDSLTRRVTAPSMKEPVTYELVEMSLVYLKKVSPETNPRKHINDKQYGPGSAGYLVAFLNRGDTEFSSFLWGKDAIDFVEKWLKVNKK